MAGTCGLGRATLPCHTFQGSLSSVSKRSSSATLQAAVQMQAAVPACGQRSGMMPLYSSLPTWRRAQQSRAGLGLEQVQPAALCQPPLMRPGRPRVPLHSAAEDCQLSASPPGHRVFAPRATARTY